MSSSLSLASRSSAATEDRKRSAVRRSRIQARTRRRLRQLRLRQLRLRQLRDDGARPRNRARLVVVHQRFPRRVPHRAATDAPRSVANAARRRRPRRRCPADPPVAFARASASRSVSQHAVCTPIPSSFTSRSHRRHRSTPAASARERGERSGDDPRGRRARRANGRGRDFARRGARRGAVADRGGRVFRVARVRIPGTNPIAQSPRGWRRRRSDAPGDPRRRVLHQRVREHGIAPADSLAGGNSASRYGRGAIDAECDADCDGGARFADSGPDESQGSSVGVDPGAGVSARGAGSPADTASARRNSWDAGSRATPGLGATPPPGPRPAPDSRRAPPNRAPSRVARTPPPPTTRTPPTWFDEDARARREQGRVRRSGQSGPGRPRPRSRSRPRFGFDDEDVAVLLGVERQRRVALEARLVRRRPETLRRGAAGRGAGAGTRTATPRRARRPSPRRSRGRGRDGSGHQKVPREVPTWAWEGVDRRRRRPRYPSREVHPPPPPPTRLATR